ncbi:MAG: C45 family peptidase [Spirosomataceae bacterium]
MKTILPILFLIASWPTLSQAQLSQREIREIRLSGTGYALGLQHGQLLKKEIGELVIRMKKNTADNLKKDADQVIKDFMTYAQFTEDIKKYTPDLYEEVRGIAHGSGQAFHDIMLFNLLDEFWVYIDAVSHHHCSGLGVPSVNGSTAYIAQNMDIESYTDGYQMLIRLARTEKSPEQFIITHPGAIGFTGMNEAGIGACMNTIMQLKSAPKGLPVAFIVRRILNSTDKNDLLHFIQTVPHASGQNYLLGIQGEVYDFEASANKVIRFDPKNANGTVYHTNHPIVNDDIKEWAKRFDPTLTTKPVNSNTYIRLAAVQNRVMANPAVNDILIKETLRSKDDKENPVCRAPKNGGFTFASVIMTLTGMPYLQVTAGPPDESEYKRIDFTQLRKPD